MHRLSRGLGALALVALAGCSSGKDAAAPTAPPLSSSKPPPTATAHFGPSMQAVALTGSGDALLVRVWHDRTAVIVSQLEPPKAGEFAISASLSSGPSPETCVVWSPNKDALGTISCYFSGSAQGEVVAGTKNVFLVALRPDGHRIAWVENDFATSSDAATIDVADLDGGQLGVVTTIAPDQVQHGANSPVLDGPDQVAWAGNAALAVSIAGEDNEGRGLVVLGLDPRSVRQGWENARPVQPEPANGFRYDEVLTADDRSAVAIQNTTGLPVAPAARALRVDLATGHALAVLARSLPGRFILQISGGTQGFIYATQADNQVQDIRFYAQFPGDPVGARITGLPPSTTSLVAAE